MIPNNYVCDGQMHITDFIKPPQKGFCWDDDINEIYHQLENLVSKHGLSSGKPEWVIWKHVPQYGYRMTYEIQFTRDTYTQDVLDDLERIVKYAKGKKVELSPMQPHFFGDNKATMYVFSTFMDNRQKINR